MPFILFLSAVEAEKLTKTKWAQFFETPCSSKDDVREKKNKIHSEMNLQNYNDNKPYFTQIILFTTKIVTGLPLFTPRVVAFLHYRGHH